MLTEEEGRQRLLEDQSARIRALEEALEPIPHAVEIGAANMPCDSTAFAPDYRMRLPEGHPERVRAEQTGEIYECLEPRTVQMGMVAIAESARRAGHAGPSS